MNKPTEAEIEMWARQYSTYVGDTLEVISAYEAQKAAYRRAFDHPYVKELESAGRFLNALLRDGNALAIEQAERANRLEARVEELEEKAAKWDEAVLRGLPPDCIHLVTDINKDESITFNDAMNKARKRLNDE